MLDLRMDEGLIGKEAAREALLAWARANGFLS
jgi:poly(A) polymerase